MRRSSFGSITFDILNYSIIIFLCIVTIYPFWYSLVMSVSSAASVTGRGLTLWPAEIDITSWKIIVSSSYMWHGFLNTIVRTAAGTVISLILTVTTAYPLSRKGFPHRKIMLYAIIFTMIFNGGMIPGFILIKNLNMINTFWALVLPAAISPFNVIIMKNFFQSLPDSLEESAKIDGANDIVILFGIILPLSLAVIATVSLWIMVGYWNMWFDAMLYINERSKYVLQQILRDMVIMNTDDPAFTPATGAKPLAESMKGAATLFVTIPILLVYPFLQKYFAKGIMLGSVKG